MAVVVVVGFEVVMWPVAVVVVVGFEVVMWHSRGGGWI